MTGDLTAKEQQFIRLVEEERAKQRKVWGDEHDDAKSFGDWAILFGRFHGRMFQAMENASIALVGVHDAEAVKAYFVDRLIDVGDELVVIAALAMAAFRVIDPRDPVEAPKHG